MTFQTINVGTAPNDKTGDSLRVGGQKIDANFASLAAVAQSGSASDLTTGTLPSARLPVPSTTTLGGVQAVAAVSHQWLNAISTAGVPSATQPALVDLSDGAPFLGITSAQIASHSLASFTRFVTIDGAPWIKGSGPYTITDAGGQAWQLDTSAPEWWVHWFGADTTGATSSTTAFNAAFAAGATYGIKLRARGTFIFSNVVSTTLSAGQNFRFEADLGTTFTASVGYPHNRLFIFQGGDATSSFYWKGGKFDGTNIPNSVGSEANDCLSINLGTTTASAKSIIVEEVETTSGGDWLNGGGDSGIFAAWANFMSFKRCRVSGHVDCGIYISGGSTVTGGTTPYSGEIHLDEIHADNCLTAVICKRRFHRVHVNRVTLVNCPNGVVIGGSASLSDGSVDLTVQDASVNSIIAYNTETALTLRCTDNAVVHGVISREMGAHSTNGATYSSTVAQAVYLQGASRCAITGVVAKGVNGSIPAPASRSVALVTRTENSVVYNSTNNTITDIDSTSVGQSVYEGDANQNGNLYLISAEGTVTNVPTIAGANSVYRRNNAGNAYEINAPAVSLGGYFANEAFRAVKAASQVNYVCATGAATGGNVAITFTGSDTNVNGILTAKGTGVVMINGSAGNEALRVSPGITGGTAVQIIPAAAGSGVAITARGGGTNEKITIAPKGTANVGLFPATATPAGGTTALGLTLGSTANFGVFFGSGAPTLSAAQGSLYLRSDGSSSSTRLYVNSNGSTSWVAVTTAS